MKRPTHNHPIVHHHRHGATNPQPSPPQPIPIRGHHLQCGSLEPRSSSWGFVGLRASAMLRVGHAGLMVGGVWGRRHAYRPATTAIPLGDGTHYHLGWCSDGSVLKMAQDGQAEDGCRRSSNRAGIVHLSKEDENFLGDDDGYGNGVAY